MTSLNTTSKDPVMYLSAAVSFTLFIILSVLVISQPHFRSLILFIVIPAIVLIGLAFFGLVCFQLGRIHTEKQAKTESGSFTMCSVCKHVRDSSNNGKDKQAWRSVEEFMLKEKGLEVSHGICPDCMKTHYQDFAD